MIEQDRMAQYANMMAVIRTAMHGNDQNFTALQTQFLRTAR